MFFKLSSTTKVIHIIFAKFWCDLKLFLEGNTIFSPGGSIVCQVSSKEYARSTLWGKKWAMPKKINKITQKISKKSKYT